MYKAAAENLLKAGRTYLNTFSQARSLMTHVPSPGDGAYHTVTLIPGDGIGPEVTGAVTQVVKAVNAPVLWERFDLSGTAPNGQPQLAVPENVVQSMQKNHVALKGTLYTHIDKDIHDSMSLNMQIRRTLDLSVNIVHAFSMPGLTTRHDNIDIVVIRENTEGEYSGLEHEVAPGIVESLKVITEAKSRRTAEYAFEYAFLNNRKKVTAIHKANIMKLADGQFLKVCREVAEKYPTIKYDEMIIDNTCMQLVSKPEQFDVMVTPNLYGQLVSNVAAGLCGGSGMCPGANIGEGIAVFEQGARHVAKELAGKNAANPTAMMLSTAMLFRHIKLHTFADRLERAVAAVYAKKDVSLLTPDVGGTASTTKFLDQVIKYI